MCSSGDVILFHSFNDHQYATSYQVHPSSVKNLIPDQLLASPLECHTDSNVMSTACHIPYLSNGSKINPLIKVRLWRFIYLSSLSHVLNIQSGSKSYWVWLLYILKHLLSSKFIVLFPIISDNDDQNAFPPTLSAGIGHSTFISWPCQNLAPYFLLGGCSSCSTICMSFLPQ